MRAIDFKYEYEAIFPNRTISESEMLDVYNDVENDKHKLFDECGYGFDDYEENIQHVVIKEMCKRLGIKYTRRLRDG